MSYEGRSYRGRRNPYSPGMRGDQRGIARDDPARDAQPYIEPRPATPPRPEPWYDARFTHEDPHERYRGPDVPGPEPARRFASDYEPPHAPQPVGRVEPPWPGRIPPPEPPPVPESHLPTYEDGLMTNEQWDELLNRVYPGRRGAAPPDFGPLAPQPWPQFEPPVPEGPVPGPEPLPFKPVDAFMPPDPLYAAPPMEPAFEPPPTYEMPMPDFGMNLEQRLDMGPPAMPEPFGPALAPGYELGPEPPPFLRPEPLPMIEPYGGLEQRLLEPPPFDGFGPPPMPFF